MIDPRKITPLLTNMSVDRELGHGAAGTVYLVTRKLDGQKLTLKHVPIPTSDAQTKALIFAGAVADEAQAMQYYTSLVRDIKSELLMVNEIKNAANILKFRGYQLDRKLIGAGYDVYLLADYCTPLPNYISAHPLTRLQAVNLAIDLCSALEQLRSVNLIHKDVRPSNIYLGKNHHFLLGDLGLTKLDSLEYSSMPDHLLSSYTAPEVIPDEASLSSTMDIYSVGMVLYEVYNGGVLPVDSKSRTAVQELPVPAFADDTLAEIILKACAYDPAERYQDPTEMKQALVLYLQRGNVTSDPLIPPAAPDVDDTALDVAAIAAAVEAGQAAEGAENPAEAEETAENAEDAEVTEILSAAFQETPKVTLNDLSEDDLLMPPESEISVEDFLASIRSTPGLEVLSMDDQGNTATVPGYETEETLPEDTEYVDSADNHPTVDADAIAEGILEEMDPPETYYAPQPEAEPEVPAEPEPEPEPEAVQEEPEAPPAPRRKRRPRPQTEDMSYDDGYEETPEDEDDEEPSGSTWKKVLISVIVLLVLAGGAFGLYTFKSDTVETLDSQVLSSTSVEIQADLKRGSSSEVICSTAAGEITRVPVTDNTAVFTDLNPDTAYTFTLSSTDGKLLLGSKTLDARTNQMTSLTGFTASSVSAVSATLALSGTGPQPDSWVVTATGEDGSSVTATSSDVEILVEGLTPNTTYTATIARGDGDVLGGTTSCTFQTMDYTTLNSFGTSAVGTDSITVQWSYEGTVPDSWTVVCEGSDGSAVTQDVSGTECTLDGLVSGVTYNISLSCPSLYPTELSSISTSVPSVNITEISSIQNEDGDIEVHWEYTGDTTPSQWSVSYVYDCESEVTPTLVTTDTNEIVLEDLVPKANYTITIQSADDIAVGGTAQTTCVTDAAEDFTSYGASNASMTLYTQEDETETTSFTTSQHIKFEIEVNYEATDEDKTVSPLYVVRDSDGTPVYVYYSNGRTWSGSWLTARHNGSIPDMPQRPGEYTLEAYFDGKFLASADFTVNAE